MVLAFARGMGFLHSGKPVPECAPSAPLSSESRSTAGIRALPRSIPLSAQGEAVELGIDTVDQIPSGCDLQVQHQKQRGDQGRREERKDEAEAAFRGHLLFSRYGRLAGEPMRFAFPIRDSLRREWDDSCGGRSPNELAPRHHISSSGRGDRAPLTLSPRSFYSPK